MKWTFALLNTFRFTACRQMSTCWCSKQCKPVHLICFKQWTAEMVLDIIYSAMRLKALYPETNCKILSYLSNRKVTIINEVNEPVLNLAVTKAATFLGAQHVILLDKLLWDNDYNGKIFSAMTDIMFVSTATHMCVQRFAAHATVPVICMKTRSHAAIQSMATVMSMMAEFGTLNLNICYVGPSHPVLNSYLLLCPMLGANIRFKCCCDKIPVSPLLYKAGEDLGVKNHIEVKQCMMNEDVLDCANVIVAGPTSLKKGGDKKFTLTLEDIKKATENHWVFYHTCPRGEEIDNSIFWHPNARTFDAFQNMQYIAAALMYFTVKQAYF